MCFCKTGQSTLSSRSWSELKHVDVRRPMTTVTDVNRGDVGVENDDEDGGGGTGGAESVSPEHPRLDPLRHSVVARLLLDNRPPSLQTPTRRSNIASEAARGLRSLPPPVDLSATAPVSAPVIRHVLSASLHLSVPVAYANGFRRSNY